MIKLAQKNKEIILKILIASFVIIGITSILLYLISFSGGLSKTHSRWAEFGSFIGGVLSPIVGILAFIGLFYNLELTKKQFKKENSDSTFFKMIDLHLKKVDTVSFLNSNDAEITSFHAFKHYVAEYNKLFDLIYSRIARHAISKNCEVLSTNAHMYLWSKFYQYFDGEKHYTTDYSKLFEFFKSRDENDNYENLKAVIGTEENIKEKDYKELVSIGFYVNYNSSSKDRVSTVRLVHSYFYQDFGHILGHYFRNIHYLLDFIDNSDDSERYSKIFRAQLSRYELALIYYNALSDMSSKRTVEMLVKYDMLNGLYSTDISYEPDEKMVKEDLKTRINYVP
jgi:hypothetical protein